MKLYNANELFIGKVGNTSDEGTKINIKFIGYAIVKQASPYYNDVISDTAYIDFHNSGCNSGGKLAIYQPVSLILYLQKNYEKNLKSEQIRSIINKIIKLEPISKSEINTLIFYLNNKNSFYNCNENNAYTIDLNEKKFINEPATSVEDKLTEVMIYLASNEKTPILIGNIGTGKNTLINEIIYKIQKNNCPKFLKKVKLIDITKLITLDNVSKEFEDEIFNLINLNTNKQIIFIIKNIHSLYSLNTQLATIIKASIDELNLKVIGTTTPDKYNELIKENNLSKKFTQIFIDEPNGEILYEIINKTFNDYSKNNKIKLSNNIEDVINLLIDLTKEENRIWNSDNINLNTNIIYNPGLVIEIIDLIFAHAKANNQNSLNIDNIKYAIKKSDKLKEEIKDEYINKIDSLKKEKSRVISLKYLKIFDKE